MNFYFNLMDDNTILKLDQLSDKLNLILSLLSNISRKESTMTQELHDLTAEVAAATSIEASAVALIEGLADQLAAAGTDPVALSNLTASLKSSADALAAAVAANTSGTPPATAPADPTAPTDPTAPADPTSPAQPGDPTTPPSGTTTP